LTGAFRVGFEHGLLCVGSGWVMMLLLFVAGVMNLGVIAALTALWHSRSWHALPCKARESRDCS